MPSELNVSPWKLTKKIGSGAFGEIYECCNSVTNNVAAIKIEHASKRRHALKIEVAVLKALQFSPYVCRYIDYGYSAGFQYLIMERMGENLSELRKRQAFGRFNMQTVLKLGAIFLKVIEHVHRAGFLHRDVKPSNFVVGLNGRANFIYIIDFGLARRHILSTGQVRPEKECPGFRGTARYASINSHVSRDLGRRDDLWSVLYILIEFSRGFLPWSNIKNREEIRDTKIQLNTPELVSKLPPEFLEFMNHLQALEFADRPNYEYFIRAFERRLKRLEDGCPTMYDWIGTDVGGAPETSRRSYFLNGGGARIKDFKKKNLSSPKETHYRLPENCQSDYSAPIYKLVAVAGSRMSSLVAGTTRSNGHTTGASRSNNYARLGDIFVLNSESVNGFVRERVKKSDSKMQKSQEIVSLTNASQCHVDLSEYERERLGVLCTSCVLKTRQRFNRASNRLCRCTIL